MKIWFSSQILEHMDGHLKKFLAFHVCICSTCNSIDSDHSLDLGFLPPSSDAKEILAIKVNLKTFNPFHVEKRKSHIKVM